MQGYSPLKNLGAGLWVRDGEWYGTAFRRRMTVMALKNGDLVIHNPFQLNEEDLSDLKSLGKIVGIVMPNTFHGDDVGWIAERVPDAKVFVPAPILHKIKMKHRVDGTLEADWPHEWSSDIKCLPIEGLRFLHESVFFHCNSKTLVLTDLAFNMAAGDFKNSIERKLMAWNRVGLGFGPSWLCNRLFTRDLGSRWRSIETLLNWDFDRVIVNHGKIVEHDGKTLMNSAFRMTENTPR
jgi:Domain of unknown function (DUF4336)